MGLWLQAVWYSLVQSRILEETEESSRCIETLCLCMRCCRNALLSFPLPSEYLEGVTVERNLRVEAILGSLGLSHTLLDMKRTCCRETLTTGFVNSRHQRHRTHRNVHGENSYQDILYEHHLVQWTQGKNLIWSANLLKRDVQGFIWHRWKHIPDENLCCWKTLENLEQ